MLTTSDLLGSAGYGPSERANAFLDASRESFNSASRLATAAMAAEHVGHFVLAVALAERSSAHRADALASQALHREAAALAAASGTPPADASDVPEAQ